MKKLLIAGVAAASFIAVSTYASHTQNNSLLSSTYDEYQQDTSKKHSDTSKHKMKKWKDSTDKKWPKDSTKKKP